jgi:hypothetical protein
MASADDLNFVADEEATVNLGSESEEETEYNTEDETRRGEQPGSKRKAVQKGTQKKKSKLKEAKQPNRQYRKEWETLEELKGNKFYCFLQYAVPFIFMFRLDSS